MPVLVVAPSNEVVEPPEELLDPVRVALSVGLDAAVLEAFVGDYLADTARVRRGERIEAVGSRFLLSTDFFQHGGDESRALRYVAYFDPYRSPCYNPLAEFDA